MKSFTFSLLAAVAAAQSTTLVTVAEASDGQPTAYSTVASVQPVGTVSDHQITVASQVSVAPIGTVSDHQITVPTVNSVMPVGTVSDHQITVPTVNSVMPVGTVSDHQITVPTVAPNATASISAYPGNPAATAGIGAGAIGVAVLAAAGIFA